MAERRATMPSSVSEDVSWFDRFAGAASRFVSQAWFFAACVLVILLWAPTLFLMDVNTSQLIVNTATTILTTLLVALLQNSQQRADQATQHKLNAIAAGLAEMMQAHAVGAAGAQLDSAVRELCAAVGLEDRESA